MKKYILLFVLMPCVHAWHHTELASACSSGVPLSSKENSSSLQPSAPPLPDFRLVSGSTYNDGVHASAPFFDDQCADDSKNNESLIVLHKCVKDSFDALRGALDHDGVEDAIDEAIFSIRDLHLLHPHDFKKIRKQGFFQRIAHLLSLHARVPETLLRDFEKAVLFSRDEWFSLMKPKKIEGAKTLDESSGPSFQAPSADSGGANGMFLMPHSKKIGYVLVACLVFCCAYKKRKALKHAFDRVRNYMQGKKPSSVL